MRTEDQTKKISEILTDTSPKTERDDEVWLADQGNQLRRLVPEYKDEEVFEYERRVLLNECHERGMTVADIAALDARQVAKLRAETLRKQENERLDRVVKSGKKTGRNSEALAGDILRAVGAHHHKSGALR